MSGVSLVGLPALQALLYHCHYFQHVSFSASNCYQGRHTFHLHSCADTISGPRTQENNLLGRCHVCVNLIIWILTWLHFRTGYMYVYVSRVWLSRFWEFFVVLEKRPTGIHYQLEETFQLSLHVQHCGQQCSCSLRCIYINTKCWTNIKPNGILCFPYRLEVQGYILQRVPLHWASQKIPLPADWWLKVLQTQMECFYVCSFALILTVKHHSLHFSFWILLLSVIQNQNSSFPFCLHVCLK